MLIKTNNMKTSKAGIELIKKFEGFEPKAYLCPANVPTIGYGHTRTVTEEDVKWGKKITEEYAEFLLIEDIIKVEEIVNKYVNVSLTQGQFDALVSFVYNLGEGNFSRSTLLKKLNNGDYEGARYEFDRWVYAKGQKLKGLVKRRNMEQQLFDES